MNASAPDLGADGDAMQTRPRVTERVKVRITATRTVEREITRFVDALLIDRMAYAGQLSDRQYAAAVRLHGIAHAAGQTAHVTQQYRMTPEHVDDEAEAPPEGVEREYDETLMQASLRVYRRLLRDAGGLWGPILDKLMRGQHPGVQWLATCQEALEWLADDWGMER